MIYKEGEQTMSDTERSEVIDLVEKKTDNFNLASWRDDKSVFLSFGYTTIAIPINDYEPFCDFITETREELADFRSEEASIMPLEGL